MLASIFSVAPLTTTISISQAPAAYPESGVVRGGVSGGWQHG